MTAQSRARPRSQGVALSAFCGLSHLAYLRRRHRHAAAKSRPMAMSAGGSAPRSLLNNARMAAFAITKPLVRGLR